MNNKEYSRKVKKITHKKQIDLQVFFQHFVFLRIFSRENDDSTITQDIMLRHHIANLNRRTLEYLPENELDVANVGVNGENVGVNGENVGVKLTTKTAERATKALRAAGVLVREGSDKTGRWVILK